MIDFTKLKGRRVYQFVLDEETGEITDITSRDDYVRVVRCKDCKYCSIDNYADGNVPIYECTFWDNGTSADGYCHEAQRKEE